MTTLVLYYRHYLDGRFYTECFYNVTEWKPDIFAANYGEPISWMFV